MEDAKRDRNYITTLMGVDMTTGLLPTRVYVDETTHRLLVSAVVTSGLTPASYDYVGTTYPTATTETWVYKTGGAGGTTVATIDLVYTDATKENISSITRT